MPYLHISDEIHRSKFSDARFYYAACVARTLSKRELEVTPEAIKTRDAEWNLFGQKILLDVCAIGTILRVKPVPLVKKSLSDA